MHTHLKQFAIPSSIPLSPKQNNISVTADILLSWGIHLCHQMLKCCVHFKAQTWAFVFILSSLLTFKRMPSITVYMKMTQISVPSLKSLLWVPDLETNNFTPKTISHIMGGSMKGRSMCLVSFSGNHKPYITPGMVQLVMGLFPWWS